MNNESEINLEESENDSILDLYEYQNNILVWTKPAPKQEWLIQPDGIYVSSLSFSTSVRKDSVSNMILDLVYVLLIYSLTNSFRSELTNTPWFAIRNLFALYSPIWHSWMGLFRYLNLFEENDLVYTLFFFLNLVGAAALSINTENCGSAGDRTGCVHFVWNIAILRLITVLGYFYGWYFNPRYHKFLKLRIINDVVRLLLWFITGFLLPKINDQCHKKDHFDSCWTLFYTFWWISWFADNLQWLHIYYYLKSNYFSGKNEMLPLDTSLVVERHEMFLLISLGEVIMAVEYRRESTSYDLAPVSLITIIVGLMKVALFDLNPAPSPTGKSGEKHALNRPFFMGVIWTYIYMPLNIVLVMIGAIMVTMKKTFRELLHNHSIVLSFSFAFIIIFITIIDLLHGERSKPRRVNRFYRILFGLFFSVMMAVLPFINDWNESSNKSLEFLLVHVIIFMFYVALIYYSNFPSSVAKSKRDRKQNIIDPLNDSFVTSSDGNIEFTRYSSVSTKYCPCEYY
jgi:hypothetical protein